MKIFSNGSITDDCPIIYSANASLSSTNCKIKDTSVSGSNTSVTISTPATSVVNTNANIYQQCLSGWIETYGFSDG